MLTREMADIIDVSRPQGWILEPDAKRLFSMAKLDVPRFVMAGKIEEGVQFANRIGYPVVAKVVSPKVIHKSEKNGVAVGLKNDQELAAVFNRFIQVDGFAGVLVEEMLSGLELIVGAKIDSQFGPVVMLGMGGTGVEIYKDVSLRMAPLSQRDTESMIRCLKAHQLLEGYRGAEPVDLKELTKLLKAFSEVVMDLEKEIESIDLNPVICSSTRCVVADARIMLKR